MNEPLPREWVEKLFRRFGEIYGERAPYARMSAFELRLVYTVWANALAGLGAGEIRRGLGVCEMHRHEDAPHPVKFWHWAKGFMHPRKKALMVGGMQRY